ncbi:MAG: hypothetical protein KAH48_06005 [Chlorobi bacterium]|nr:hypothetical protein [Chlorobiota bacterium]
MKILTIVVSLLILVILSSCSSISPLYNNNTGMIHIQEADYENSRYEQSNLRRPKILISGVKDLRGQYKTSKRKNNEAGQSSYIRTTYIGSISSPLKSYMLSLDYFYRFDDSAEDFTKISLQKIFASSDTAQSSEKIPVRAEIIRLNVSDEWNPFYTKVKVSCEINFLYSDKNGEQIVRTSYEDSFTSSGPIVERVQYLVYDALYECGKQFISTFDTSYEYDFTNAVAVDTRKIYDYKKAYEHEYFSSYQAGIEQLKSRISLGYFLRWNDQYSRYNHRFGWKLSVISTNTEALGADQFIDVSLVYSPFLFLNESHEGLFFNPELELSFAMESSDNPDSYNGYDMYLIYGAFLNAKVGYHIGPVCIKAGLFALKYFNSKDLSGDTGLMLEFGLFIN